MRQVAVRLENWRMAERRRGALPAGSAAWLAAAGEVRHAQAAYQAEAAQMAAHLAELDIARSRPDGLFAEWPARMDRVVRVSG